MQDSEIDMRNRLEYLRGEIRAERISYGEIAELQSLATYIDPEDIELLEWAGVPERAIHKPYTVFFILDGEYMGEYVYAHSHDSAIFNAYQKHFTTEDSVAAMDCGDVPVLLVMEGHPKMIGSYYSATIDKDFKEGEKVVALLAVGCLDAICKRTVKPTDEEVWVGLPDGSHTFIPKVRVWREKGNTENA